MKNGPVEERAAVTTPGQDCLVSLVLLVVLPTSCRAACDSSSDAWTVSRRDRTSICVRTDARPGSHAQHVDYDDKTGRGGWVAPQTKRAHISRENEMFYYCNIFVFEAPTETYTQQQLCALGTETCHMPGWCLPPRRRRKHPSAAKHFFSPATGRAGCSSTVPHLRRC